MIDTQLFKFPGWGVELHRASNALTNETISLGCPTNEAEPGQAFAEKHGIGNQVFELNM